MPLINCCCSYGRELPRIVNRESGSYPPELKMEDDKIMKQTADVPVIILSTAAPDNAKVIARALVEDRFAACVNMTVVSSYYYWKGEFCDDTETLLIIKTMDSRKSEVMDAIRRLHTYELPEMIVIPVTGGFPPYLTWLNEEVIHGRSAESEDL